MHHGARGTRGATGDRDIVQRERRIVFRGTERSKSLLIGQEHARLVGIDRPAADDDVHRIVVGAVPGVNADVADPRTGKIVAGHVHHAVIRPEE